jgi:hypothetical protein
MTQDPGPNVPAILYALRHGASSGDMARKFGITKERVRQIWLRETGHGLTVGRRDSRRRKEA